MRPTSTAVAIRSPRIEDAAPMAGDGGCRQVVVGTRITREGAHRFYTREGYKLAKTSHFFEKGL